MFLICLFDLDETLIRTDDLKEIREAGKYDETPAYIQELLIKLNQRGGRHIYDQTLLHRIRNLYPNMKMCVFTRSPRSYANAVLKWAYPGFVFDMIVAYEDVRRTKPYGDGIDAVMENFGVLDTKYLHQTLLIGDGDSDIRAAYHCGCVVVLDKSAWPVKKASEHWNAIEHVPDAIIESPQQIIDVLSRPNDFLPELELALTGQQGRMRTARFDVIGHFVPAVVGGDNTSHPIYVCGRLFSKHDSVKFRHQSHDLTKSIEENKESDSFPVHWVETIRTFIAKNYIPYRGSINLIVSVVPHRPGRKPRLEKLLDQLIDSIKNKSISNVNVRCEPKLLAYRDGVRSQHNDYLGRDDRFINVRDYLVVASPELVDQSCCYLVIDDVVTTGASLLYAKKYLRDIRSVDVKCLALAKNIGDVVQ